MAPAPEAVLYAAKSTEDVHGSIATQLEDCQALAEGEGWEVVEKYVDEGFSAYSGNRGPGLERAREHVTRIGGILVAQHSDRVARGAGDRPDAADHLVEVVASLRRAGAQLRTCQDDFFADPRIGLVMASLMGQRNTEDSKRKSEASRAGKRRAFENGDFPGGHVPDGFEVIGRKDERTIRLDPERIGIIKLIGELSDQGLSDGAIARELNRRGLQTQRRGDWRRIRIQDLLTNPIYYGGVSLRNEINWEASHPAPWTREDFDRRAAVRAERATGAAPRQRGRPPTNHALAGLAYCGWCMGYGRHSAMYPVTSSYRRKDGSRKRTYVCDQVHDSTGLCDAPRIDAELVDTHVVNELQRYLGDFEAWRDQLTSGYTAERQRLEGEVAKALEDLTEQERICKRMDRAMEIAETDDDLKTATRVAGNAHRELERRQLRVDAARQALDAVPNEAPADAMLDFYIELQAAVKGRLEGANTIARVNDALKDIFSGFSLIPPPHDLGEGILVAPSLRRDRTETQAPELAWITGPDSWREFRADPPLRTIQAPERKSPTPL